ncbi:hypothetical protein D3P07_24240 [Paenibacillus sp. 1011MAR3C5]|uniref:hypothetical protein n=1 Tax=Paenibacillus sp. 1011MAR3C5 TaxID=1675787 RepID=UPI000E6C5AE3|nr:hypothetical protein [Paenibacillus sp. 1011MAR3C5]RJE83923.1 hypothetical protein D3P07_24240 [Paenibacillus sp. 1011MAR3C5]
MNRFRTSILIGLTVLLLSSVILNVIQNNKNKKTEFALYQVAMDFNLLEYRKIGTIYQSLAKAAEERKLYANDFRLHEKFQQLSMLYMEMVMLYGTLHSYQDISSIGTNRMFDMLQDFGQYFSLLNYAQSLSLAEDEIGQYVQLTDRQVESIAEIAQVMGELDHIRLGVGSSSDDIRSNWVNIMLNNEAISNSPGVVEKHQHIINEIKSLSEEKQS